MRLNKRFALKAGLGSGPGSLCFGLLLPQVLDKAHMGGRHIHLPEQGDQFSPVMGLLLEKVEEDILDGHQEC